MPVKKPRSKHLLTGQTGEDIACKILTKKGYEIIERNFHCRWGEIDVIARDGDTLVFVEVKARRSLRYGYPEEAVTPTKLEKIKKTIRFYLKQKKVVDIKIRIEVMALRLNESKVLYKLIVCEN